MATIPGTKTPAWLKTEKKCKIKIMLKSIIQRNRTVEHGTMYKSFKNQAMMWIIWNMHKPIWQYTFTQNSYLYLKWPLFNPFINEIFLKFCTWVLVNGVFDRVIIPSSFAKHFNEILWNDMENLVFIPWLWKYI